MFFKNGLKYAGLDTKDFQLEFDSRSLNPFSVSITVTLVRLSSVQIETNAILKGQKPVNIIVAFKPHMDFPSLTWIA